MSHSQLHGFYIALIVLAPLILLLISFEFSMYLIQSKNSYFKKQKTFDRGCIIDLVVLLLTGAILGLLIWQITEEDVHILEIATFILWDIMILSTIAFIIARVCLIKKWNKTKKLKPNELLTKPIEEICAFVNIKDFKYEIDHPGFKNGNWSYIINNDYQQLVKNIQAIQPTFSNDQIGGALADCIIFQEKSVANLNPNKRRYATALFLNLLSLIKQIYNAKTPAQPAV